MKIGAVILTLSMVFVSGCSESEYSASVTKARVLVKGSMYGLAVDPAKVTDVSTFEKLGRGQCQRFAICQTHFWYDGSMMPDKFPMQDAEAAAEVAVYQKNTNTGLDRTLLRCNLFPSTPKDMCF